jgi:hypothetical protein
VKNLNWRFIMHEFCVAMREVAVLWLVFSVLDKLLTEQLTLRWAAGNCGGAAVLWIVATLVEARTNVELA